jgi:nucleoid DNA-binding protein
MPKTPSHLLPPTFTETLAQELNVLLDFGILHQQHIRTSKGYKLIRTVLKVMIAALRRGERIDIPHLGTFYTVRRGPQTRRMTWKQFNNTEPHIAHVKPHTVVKFTPSKDLQRALDAQALLEEVQ